VRLGAILPQTEIGPDPADLVKFASAVETAGLDFLDVYEHVLGADRATRPDWDGPYDLDSQFHEPFVLFGFLAAHTTLELSTSVLVLPQRQTTLVAKQAAEADVLSGGRLRLGVGIGWNPVEYDALGSNFRDRAARYEEQIHLLRLLWTQRSVTFHGRFEHIEAAGLLPMPVQQPIPIWMGGGTARPVLERIGRIGDGWLCTTVPGHGLEEAVAIIHGAAVAAGRDPGEIGLQGGVNVGAAVDRDRIRRHLDTWERAGASYAVISAIGSGRTPQEHIDVIQEAAAAALDR